MVGATVSLPKFPAPHVNMGPRCAACLQHVPQRRYVSTDDCNEACIAGHSLRAIGEQVAFGHLHWECDCGYTWATQTATQSGHDPERQ